MTLNRVNSPLKTANSEYRVQLKEFEGPLDLLLYLVRKAQLDITEISLATVAQQYFEYLECMQSLNIEIESSYIVVLAQLVELKSRLLLPQGCEEEEPVWDTSDLLDPQAASELEEGSASLVKRLSLYALVKEASDWLGNREELTLARYVRPQGPEADLTLPLELQVSLEALASAFQRLNKLGANALRPVKLERVRLSVAERVQQLRQELQPGRQYPFLELLGPEPSRAYLVVTFLALLEMVKEALLALHQVAPDRLELELLVPCPP